jgi:hypothetical protein
MKVKNGIVIIFALFALFFTAVVNETAGSVTGSVLFQSNLGGSARYALKSGNYLYSLMGSKLYIADITDLKNPVEIGSFPLPGIGRRLEIKDTVLYISCTEGGLATVDVSNPSKPKLLDTLLFDTSQKAGEVFDVALYGDYAFVADYRTGLHIVDIKDPSNVILKGSFTDFENREDFLAYDVYVNGTFLYVCCEHDGLYIFDISNPLNVTLQSHFKGPAGVGSQFYQTYREDNYLYIAAGIGGLLIVDAHDIRNPVYVNNIENNYQGVLGLAKTGDFVYLCTEFADFYKIDVSDFYHLKQAESFSVEGNHSLGINKEDNLVFLANSNYGIRIFDVSEPTIKQVSVFTSVGRVIDCQGQGNYAYVAAGKNGLQIFDVTDPLNPSLVSKTALSGYANGLFVNSTYVYVAELQAEGQSSGGFFEIIDTSNPAAPSILSTIDLEEGAPFDVMVDKGYAFVACQSTGVSVIDVNNPSSPELISTFDTPGGSYQATLLWDSFLAVADGIRGIILLDARDPYHLMNISGGYDLGTVQDCALWDSIIFLPAGHNGVFMSDIALPFAPSMPENIIMPRTSRGGAGAINVVAVFDSYLLVPDTVAGVRLFDISKPGLPADLATEPYLVGDPIKITFNQQQGLAYVSSQIAGLYIYKVDVTPGPGINLDGRWIGSIVSNQGTTGIAAEFDQAHTNVSGTVVLFSNSVVTATLSGNIIDGSTFTGTITDGNNAASVSLIYDHQSGSLTGDIAGELQGTIQLKFAGERGNMELNTVLAPLHESISAQLTQTTGLQHMLLTLANNMLNTAMSQYIMSGKLSAVGAAELLLNFSPADTTVNAANFFVYPAAEWNALIAQSETDNEFADICADKQNRLSYSKKRGDTILNQAISLGQKGQQVRAINLLSKAMRHYEKVHTLYRQLKPTCPEFGIAEFNGYYEGVIDFGFISAVIRMCVGQDAEGTVTGGAYIAIKATGEYMTGTIVDGKNSSDSGYSIVTGTIEVPLGDITAHIIIKGFTYDASTDQWEGQVEVQEQKVTGNVTLKLVSDTCPDGWDTSEK